jgi:hypothetical protein
MIGCLSASHCIPAASLHPVAARAEIQEHFDVTGLQLLRLDAPAASELLEVYRGVVPPGEWRAAVEELSSGPSLAVEVSAAPADLHGPSNRRGSKAAATAPRQHALW